MAFTDVDNTGTTMTLNVGFGTINTNFSIAQTYLNAIFIEGEFKSDGTLVYPHGATQSPNYNPDGTFDYSTCSYDGKAWTYAFTYDVDGNVTLITASNDVPASWTKTITYNPDGTVLSEGAWV